MCRALRESSSWAEVHASTSFDPSRQELERREEAFPRKRRIDEKKDVEATFDENGLPV